MSDKDIESEIQAKGLTAPRVTPDHIESIIAQEAYFTAEDGAFGVAIKAKHTGGEVNYQPHESLSLLTFCVWCCATASPSPAKAPAPALRTSTPRLAARSPAKTPCKNLDAGRLPAEAETERKITP